LSAWPIEIFFLVEVCYWILFNINALSSFLVLTLTVLITHTVRLLVYRALYNSLHTYLKLNRADLITVLNAARRIKPICLWIKLFHWCVCVVFVCLCFVCGRNQEKERTCISHAELFLSSISKYFAKNSP